MQSAAIPILNTFLEKQCGLTRKDPILVGVSGGADSLYLLRHLQFCEYPVIAATFNHQLRPEAEQEVAYVQSLCAEWGIPFVTGSVDVAKAAQESKQTLEEAARIWRYRFLFEQARLYDAKAVAVAHQMEDQAETVLMHFLRGSGLQGLGGMKPFQLASAWSDVVPLIRPLLDTSRKAIEQWCQENEIIPVLDATNHSLLYQRSRLRSALIPQLTAEYNPRLTEILNRNARVIQGDLALLDGLTDAAWDATIDRSLSDACQIIFRRNDFVSQPAALQNRILRRAGFKLRPDARDFDQTSIIAGVEFWCAGSDFSRMPFPEKLQLHVLDHYLIIAHSEIVPNPERLPQLPPDFLMSQLPQEGELSCGAWKLVIRRFSRNLDGRGISSTEIVSNPNICLIDAGKIRTSLRLRRFQTGERWQPYGLKGKRQKLSDFWINQKVPRDLRAHYPVIADDTEIIWIPGFRCADFCAVSEKTEQFIRIELQQNLPPIV